MEKQPSYEQLISEGIKGLPQELLAEIADFIYFVRKRFTQPHIFESNLAEVLLNQVSASAAESETIKSKQVSPTWLNLPGTISQYDLQIMTEIIEAGCEKVDLDEW